LARHALQSIHKHEDAKAVVAGDLELSNVLATVSNIFQKSFLVSHETAVFLLRQVYNKALELVALDGAVAVRVIRLPTLDEVVNVLLVNRHVKSLRLIHEGIDDNSDKQVQENLRDDNIERLEEDDGDKGVAATIHFFVVVEVAVVVEFLLALKCD